MRKLLALPGAAFSLILSSTAAFAAPMVKYIAPSVSPTPIASPTPAPTVVPAAIGQSTQNTIFFIVVAVLLIAIIWYILGMPDEDDEDEDEGIKDEAPTTPSPAPKKKSAPRRRSRK